MTRRPLIVLLVLPVLLAACGGERAAAPEPVRSVLTGRFVVPDSVAAQAGGLPRYEMLVARADSAGIDTLGFAVTDSLAPDTVGFTMAIAAPERGLYPLFITQNGRRLKRDQFIIAEGDTATFVERVPLRNRPLRIRSLENAAWLAYANTKQIYEQNVARLVAEGRATEDALGPTIGQAVNILWSLRETYPGTLASELATAESIVMLSGWNDSLLVARADEVEGDNPSFVEVARVAQRAEAGRAGPDAGLALLEAFEARAEDDEAQAGLQSERVIALLGAGRVDEARVAADALIREYPDSPWATWAERARYDFDNLMPDMQAPAFTATTAAGEPFALSDLDGDLVVLEFYNPLDPDYRQQIPARNALYSIAGDSAFTIVSVSMLPDSSDNAAFLEGRDLPGIHIWAPEGMEGPLAEQYNVHLLPRRFLVGPDGTIIAKFEGDALIPLQQEVAALRGQAPEEEPPA